MSKQIHSKPVVVIIPVYETNPKSEELRAFKNNINIMKKHPVCMVTFQHCDLSKYDAIAQEIGVDLKRENFPKECFTSVAAYNDLCLSLDLYQRFTDYEYMLICQLDVWMFRDEIINWCKREFDYIGAPIYYPYSEKRYTQKFRGIGNGGLCLRRIAYCISILASDKNKPLLTPRTIMKMYWHFFRYNEAFTCSWVKRLSIIPIALGKMLGYKNSFNYFASQHVNEDLLLGTWAEQSEYYPCHLPDELTAAEFSIEVNAEWLLKRLHGKTPMGVHAYDKWNNPLVPRSE
ncbi:MAG: DUF5672 family protein [Prevotella sp.]|nr:DUF5672 family protein [Prevotella sp.]